MPRKAKPEAPKPGAVESAEANDVRVIYVTPRLLVTVDDAADALSVSKRTVYNMMRNGTLRWVLIGKDRRIPMTELQQMAASSMQPAKSA